MICFNVRFTINPVIMISIKSASTVLECDADEVKQSHFPNFPVWPTWTWKLTFRERERDAVKELITHSWPDYSRLLPLVLLHQSERWKTHWSQLHWSTGALKSSCGESVSVWRSLRSLSFSSLRYGNIMFPPFSSSLFWAVCSFGFYQFGPLCWAHYGGTFWHNHFQSLTHLLMSFCPANNLHEEKFGLRLCQTRRKEVDIFQHWWWWWCSKRCLCWSVNPENRRCMAVSTLHEAAQPFSAVRRRKVSS